MSKVSSLTKIKPQYEIWMNSFNSRIVKDIIINGDPTILGSAFSWSVTPEGHRFWNRQVENALSIETLVRLMAMSYQYRLTKDAGLL